MESSGELFFSEMGVADDLSPALMKSIQSNAAMLELVQLIEHATLTKFADEDGTLKAKVKTVLEKIPDEVLVNAEIRPLYKKRALAIDEFAKEFSKRAMEGMLETIGPFDDAEKQFQLMLAQAKAEEIVELVTKGFTAANLRLELLAQVRGLLRSEGITPAYKAEPRITVDGKGRHILHVDLAGTPQVQQMTAERKIREALCKMGASLDRETVPDGVVLCDPKTNTDHCSDFIAKTYEIIKNRGMAI